MPMQATRNAATAMLGQLLCKSTMW